MSEYTQRILADLQAAAEKVNRQRVEREMEAWARLAARVLQAEAGLPRGMRRAKAMVDRAFGEQQR